MEFSLPKQVICCLETLENAGFEAFCVGGAVRDMLLSAEPLDFDDTTNCPPQEIIKLFDKTIPTGIEHGTVTVIIDGKPIEVTTYRTEGGYSDSRHPDKVAFVGNIEDDLSRRDFTVNAIAYNPKSGIFDPFFGRLDLAKRLLRTVGEPERRFTEDALRIMRLFRFASKLDFSIESETMHAALKLLPLLAKISRERIMGELEGVLLGKSAENASPFFENGALEFLGLPKCSLNNISQLPSDRSIRFAALFIESGADGEAVLKELKSDNALKSQVSSLLRLYKSGAATCEDVAIKHILREHGEEIARKYIYLLGEEELSLKRLDRIIESGEPFCIAHLAVGGDDIKSAGYAGREVGEILSMLINKVIEDPSLNTKEKLLGIITK